MSFLIFLCGLCFKIYFVLHEFGYPHFLVISLCIKYLFPSSHFQSICVLCPKLGILWQYIVYFCFIVQSSTVCLLIRVFSPLTFNVIIDRCVFIAILTWFSSWLCITFLLFSCFSFPGLIFFFYYAWVPFCLVLWIYCMFLSCSYPGFQVY